MGEVQAVNGSGNASNGAATEPASNGVSSQSDRLPSLPRVSQDAAIVESLARVLSTPESAKLLATTRVMNSFIGYLTTVCGRRIDEMTPADVTRLATVLKAIEELEIDRSPRRHS
jgi:hypothetical protein